MIEPSIAEDATSKRRSRRRSTPSAALRALACRHDARESCATRSGSAWPSGRSGCPTGRSPSRRASRSCRPARCRSSCSPAPRSSRSSAWWPAGGGAVAAALTALLLGSRNALYGLRLSSLLRVRGARRAVAAQFVIDESAAMALARGTPGFWATGLAVFVCWNVATAAGAIGGTALVRPARARPRRGGARRVPRAAGAAPRGTAARQGRAALAAAAAARRGAAHAGRRARPRRRARAPWPRGDVGGDPPGRGRAATCSSSPGCRSRAACSSTRASSGSRRACRSRCSPRSSRRAR